MVRLHILILYLFSASIVFENWSMMSFGGNSLPKMIALALLAVISFSSRKTYDYNMLKKYLNPLFIFSIILIAPFLYNYQDYSDYFTILMSIVLNVVFFWFIGNLVVREPIIGYNMILAFISGVLFASFLYILNIGVAFEEGRMTIFGENPNKLGIFAVIAVCLLFPPYLKISGYGKKRYFLLLFLVPLLNMIAQTGSRVTFLGLMLSLVFYILLKRSRNTGKTIVYIVLGVAAIYLLFTYFMTFDILRERLISTVEDQDVSGRDRIWESIWPLIVKSPAIGVGIGGYIDYAHWVFGQNRSPHNVFIEIMAYTGVAGLFAFLVFGYNLFRDGYKILIEQKFALPFIYILFLGMVFMTGQALNVKAYWMIYLYIISSRFNLDMILKSRSVNKILE
ncbi:MAG: O-antigen ligase family protein [Bacteroidales bacterium]|nr:O-antigen ligase family protein [Bacteroidales bacterium]